MYRTFIAVSFAVLASILFFSTVDRASAQLPPDFSLPNAVGEIGERTPLNLDFTNDGQVGAINFTVEFDQNVVDFSCNGFFNVIAGPDLIGLPVLNLSAFVTNSQVTVSLDQGAGQVNPLPDGEIITINFCISESAQVGNSSSLDITVNSMTDINGGDIIPPVADTEDGSITVASEPPQNIDVSITKSADTNRIDPGVPVLIEYTISLDATGDSGAQATDVEITDALPLGSAFREDLSSDQCEMLIGPSNSIGCEVGSLIAGESQDLTIVISITGQEGADILNQAILDYVDEIGNPVQKNSNTVTIRVSSGGGGGGGCALAADSTDNGLVNWGILLLPAIFVLYRNRKSVNR